MGSRFLGVMLLVLVAAAGCRAEGTAPPATRTLEAPVPRIEPASGERAGYGGIEFDADTVPEDFVRIEGFGRSSGASIINSEATSSGAEAVAMHWAERPGRANVLVSRAAGRTAAETAIWQAVSAWDVILGDGMILTVGTIVCIPPPGSFDVENGELIAVTNAEQDLALAAWVMTVDGPTPFGDLSLLACEEFFP